MLYEPIEKNLAKENQNIALVFPSRADNAYDIYFFRVMQATPLVLRYGPDLAGTLGPNSSQSFTYLGDTGLGTGDDLIDVWKNYPMRILDFAIGIAPSNLQVYIQVPDRNEITGMAEELPPAVGDNRDFRTGRHSPYEAPTIATRCVMFYNNSFRIGFYNPEDTTVSIALNILGAGYNVVQITNTDFINKMIVGKIPVKPLTVGGLDTFTPTVPDEWEAPTTVDASVISHLMMGGV